MLVRTIWTLDVNKGYSNPPFHLVISHLLNIVNVVLIEYHKNVSEATMQQVDMEIRRIIDEQYALARKLIEENRDKIEAMTQALLEWETIDSDQIGDIMEGRAPRPPKPSKSVPSSKDDTPPAAPAATATPAQEV